MEHQFKKGQSGNPAGRPAGRRKLSRLIEEALDDTLSIAVNSRLRRVTLREAAAIRLARKAAEGDRHAIGIVLKIEEPRGEPEAKIMFWPPKRSEKD